MTPAAESWSSSGSGSSRTCATRLARLPTYRALRGLLRLAGGMTVCLYVSPALEASEEGASTARCAHHGRHGAVGRSKKSAPAAPTPGCSRSPSKNRTSSPCSFAARGAAAGHDADASARDDGISPAATSWASRSSCSSPAPRRGGSSIVLSDREGRATMVMDTENVEIIKAMVKTGPRHRDRAVSGDRARGAGRAVLRRPDRRPPAPPGDGWVYARANRVPRMIHELLAAFDAVKGKLRLAPPGRRQLPHRDVTPQPITT